MYILYIITVELDSWCMSLQIVIFYQMVNNQFLVVLFNSSAWLYFLDQSLTCATCKILYVGHFFVCTEDL